MPEIHYQHPLQVPNDTIITPKSQKRYDSGFSPTLTIGEALGYFEEECNRFPGQITVTLYSNYEHIQTDRLRQKMADDCSVCCELKYNHKSYYFVCHKWGLTEQNIYALHLTLRAIYNIVKWGVSDYESVLKGFSTVATKQISHQGALNEKELVNRGQWLAILRLQENATLDDANEAYRFYAKQAASSEEGLLRLNQAISAAREYFASHNGTGAA
jgi:hypothetical protein